jgi:hypothetical protein
MKISEEKIIKIIVDIVNNFTWDINKDIFSQSEQLKKELLQQKGLLDTFLSDETKDQLILSVNEFVKEKIQDLIREQTKQISAKNVTMNEAKNVVMNEGKMNQTSWYTPPTATTTASNKLSSHGQSLADSEIVSNFQNAKLNPVICNGELKAFYHSDKYCSCDFETLARKLTSDLHQGQNPLDRLIRCIQAREYDYNRKKLKNSGHKKTIDKLWDVYYGLLYWLDNMFTGTNVSKGDIEIKVMENYQGRAGTQFYVVDSVSTAVFPLEGHFLSEPLSGGRRKATRKAKQSKRKQTRRRR